MKSRIKPHIIALAVLAGGLLNLSAQVQITLPAPIVRETFDSVEEGKLPAGWSVTNFTDSITGAEDLDDPKSDSYMNWVVISRERLEAIAAAGGWEGARRLAVAPNQSVNGVTVTNLIENKFIYAESDVRGGNQVQYLFTPDFNLAGKSNVFVFYNSIYEQNQDNIGAVEYSIDEGKTWLPILYMLESPDIVRTADGTIDGYETLNRTNGDAAALLDPVTGEDVGHRYGAFIGISSNKWSALGPFISARVNDDGTESKRVELFRVPEGDNQAKVRFRFAQAGTGSWYFGIDNFGLYSIVQTKPNRPTITGPATVDFFSTTTLAGSPFKGNAATQTHSLSVWQISDSPSFTADKGLANVLESYTSSKDLTSLTVFLGRVRPGGTFYATVQYKDQSGGGSDFAAPTSFTVTASLPAPVVFEDFESTAEGAVPTGWTAENQTDGGGVGENPADFRSDTYLNWAVTTFENLTSFGADRVSSTNVVSGKSLYANSDSRTGNQIQFVTTPDFTLTGKSNVWLVFKSNYKQNQDSLGGLEYSVNGGTTWLPLLYMIDKDDVFVNPNGSIDAVKTLTTTAGDIAKIYLDPATGERVAAGKYGDFVQAQPIESLGPYISGRLQDADLDSKRTERLRLTAADNQAKVRFRFTQAGTDSWFWGIDDFGIYSIAPGVPARTKPDAPTITLPTAPSLLDSTLAFAGSAFVGIQASDANAQTVLQISSNGTFNPGTGLTNLLVFLTNSVGATALSVPAGRLFAGQAYFITLQYQDKNGVKSDFAIPATFTIAAPPAPIYLETFESTADFGVPAGWTVSNQTDVATAGANPADPNSDTYKDWVVVPSSTLEAFGGGRLDTNVVNGKSIYAESDNRGGNQIQVLLSPEFDLRGRNNVTVAFKSNYVQNQDSLGVLEYTVDGGNNWLALTYMIDDKGSGGDVVRTNGLIDAVTTLTKTAGDIAKMIDPATNQRVAAGKFGDFILAKPLESLGDFISGRIDDDKTESRRYERFRLTAADNQAKVRFRFVQAGTGSWWWGVDDFGIYGSGSGSTGPTVSASRQGNNVVVTWTGAGTLQSSDNITGPWSDLTGASPQTINPSTPRKFYRVRQ